MLHLAWNALLHDRARTVLSVVAAGSVLALVLVFEGFWVGIIRDLEAFPPSLPADLVVLQKGVDTVSTSRSSLRQLSRDEVEAVDGVRVAHPLLVLPLILEREGRRLPIQVVVYDSAGAPRIASGRAIRGRGELVLDRRMARYFAIEPGATLELMDEMFDVVGLSSRSGSPFAPFAFITFDPLTELYFKSGLGVSGGAVPLLGALLVELDGGTSASAARHAIEAVVDDVDVWTPAELGRNDAALGELLLGPALGLLLAIAWTIATLTMALTLYATTESRLREYAVAKAIGASPGQIAAGMLVHAAALVIAGLPVGLMAAGVVAELVTSWSPLYSVQPWEPGVVARAFGAALAAAAVGVLPAWIRVVRVPPDDVFRAAAI